MDPLSIAGVGVGAVSLSIQILKGCITGYKLFEACVGMPDDCQYVSTSFLVERGRLSSWAKAVGLEDYTDEASVSVSIRTSRLPLLAILTQIRTSMIIFLKDNRSLIEFEETTDNVDNSNDIGLDIVDAVELLNNPLGSAKADSKKSFWRKGSGAARQIKAVPVRLKWVVFEKKKTLELLERLHRLNDCLREILDAHQTHVLQETTKNTYLEILQLRNTVLQVKLLIEATKSPTEDLERASLSELANFKVLNLLAKRTPANMLESDIRFLSPNMQPARTEAVFTPRGGVATDVWIEWKIYEVEEEQDILKEEPEVLSRVEELAVLLTSYKPKELCVPPCLGFFNTHKAHDSQGHFGFVFTKPSDISRDSRLVSIRDSMDTFDEPSLDDRVTLAYKTANCILYLHSVNWLHKSLRSENIVCFVDQHSPFILTAPYLLGFGYSRPARSGETTEPTPVVPAWEIYCHPDIQQDRPNPPYYRKTFDIYSLGLVLIEIALWEPIEKVMNVTDLPNSPQDAWEIQERLLAAESPVMKKIRSRVGNKFHDAIITCIKGRDAFGISPDDREVDGETSKHLQQSFKKSVVDKLRDIVT
ncbi:hypothetical protein MMC31_002997 [Peltigera leucophlebia]|nr:hypothetical protein [Peltigera leucophlebia]